jgi:hypothetical protein
MTLPSLNASRLSKLRRLMHQFNIYPVFLPHYLKNQHPIRDALLSLVDEAHEIVCILTDDECKELLDNFSWFYKEGIKDRILGSREYTIAVYIVIHHMLHSRISFESIINNKQSEVLDLFPELDNKMDKDGLLKLDDEFIPTQFGLAYKDHVIYYHHFLRKDYGGPFIPEFLNAFIRLYHSGVESRIGIDHSRVVPVQYINNSLELDFWYGPLFDIHKIDDPKEIGLTVIGRTFQPLLESRHTLIRTEFLWQMKNKIIKQVEIEEISHLENIFDAFYFNKYIHAERDITKKCFVHFDGAVKVYQEDSLRQRIDTTLQNEVRASRKVKLFRLDGKVSTEDWVYLTSTFFRKNEMIFEYFDPEGFKNKYANSPISYLEWIEEKRKNEDN